MEREHEMTSKEANQHLQSAVDDCLVDSYIASGMKGTKKNSLDQEGFRIPIEKDDWEKGSHDWYCYECHKPGEVMLCTECHRVCHPKCAPEDAKGSKFVCYVCKEVEAVRKKPRIRRKELNRLLYYTVVRLKEKTRELHRMGLKDEPQKFSRFMYMYMDLNTMEIKTKQKKYKYLEQFRADAQVIYHNVFICFGEHGAMAQLARIMINDCQYDLDEIKLCKDCYYYSNAKPKDWFAKPCRPPHELVYAKQKGFCYWPAKVISVSDAGYDVRFFGGWHQRAVIPPHNVKPIDTNEKSLNVKRTQGYNKARAELHKLQQCTEQHSEDDDLDGDDDEEEEIPVPIKKQKIMKQEEKETEAISSSYSVPDKPAPTPEDANMVTSSEDKIHSPRIISSTDIGTQTPKKVGRPPHKAVQTDPQITNSSSGLSDCEGKLNDVKSRLKGDQKDDKEKLLKEQAERREVDRVRRQTEERCKQEYMEEMKKLAQKHKAEISSTKKKQWCYNCEEEAMYHCCWNTSYCSIKCQQEHWHKEHKRMCRRKR